VSITLTEKQALYDELKDRLTKEFQTVLAAQKAAHEGATHEEAKPENDKDTRALEQSYLARGQAERVRQLEGDIAALDLVKLRKFNNDSKIALGALVAAIDDDEKAHLYFLMPAGAGEELTSSEGIVKVVTSRSPLGRALIGSQVDEQVEVASPTGKRHLTLTSVS
jgi:transcription elongation GreA/GreB family factor